MPQPEASGFRKAMVLSVFFDSLDAGWGRQ